MFSIYPLPINDILGNAYAQEGIVTSVNPPQEVNGKGVELYFQLDPSIIMKPDQSAQQHTLLKFRLYDPINNDTIKHVSYVIRITEPFKSEAPILADMFHSHNGILILRMLPTSGLDNATRIEAQKESFYNAWLADEDNIIDIKTPLFQQAAAYKIDVAIFSVHDDKNILNQQEVPTFEFWSGRGQGLSEMVMYENQFYNTTVISYFETLRNFTFDSEKKVFNWSIPFDWNASRVEKIENVGQFFVHQAIVVPNALIDRDEKPIIATINGLTISGASLAIDEYSYESSTVFHYFIKKNELISIIEATPQPYPSEMTFTFSESSKSPEMGYWSAWDFQIDENYRGYVDYHITGDGNFVRNITVAYPDGNAIRVDIEAISDGSINLKVPRNYVDSWPYYEDIEPPVLFVDEIEAQVDSISQESCFERYRITFQEGTQRVELVRGVVEHQIGGFGKGYSIQETVRVEGNDYRLPIVTNSDTCGVSFREDEKMLVLDISRPLVGQGYYQITIPEKLLGGNFTVLADEDSIDFNATESASYSNATTIEFNYPKGATVAYIIGTTGIPEFPLQLLILPMTFAFLIVIASLKKLWQQSMS